MAGTPKTITASSMLLLNRLTLGAYLTLAGYGKVFQLGIEKFYTEKFVPMQPPWLAESGLDVLTRAYGYSIPVAELVFGILLIVGLGSRIAAGAIFLMVVSFTIALMTKMGPSGGGPVMMHVNVVLASLALLLTVIGPGRFALDGLIRFKKKG